MSQQLTDHEEKAFAHLLAEARSGSNQALGEALNSCQVTLKRKANRFRRSGALRAKWADSDLVQSTFLEAKRNFAQFAGATRQEFVAWLSGILMHNFHDLLRRFLGGKRAVKRELSLDDAQVASTVEEQLIDKRLSPEMTAQEMEMARAVERGVAKLPPHYVRVLRLRSVERLSFEQIGERLDCSAEAARKINYRALRVLADEIHDSKES
jgi:RNA polymerase sigma-70 factor (ECF subfamily)